MSFVVRADSRKPGKETFQADKLSGYAALSLHASEICPFSLQRILMPRGPKGEKHPGEVAAKAIGAIVDVSAIAEEIDRRRRHLAKGSPEFREHRLDLPRQK